MKQSTAPWKIADDSFLLVEATAERISFEAISRRGHFGDSGTLERARDPGC